MKKFLKLTGLLILLLFLSVVAFYLYMTDFGRNNMLFAGPRKPKLEIPVTYNIGWWSNQEALAIDSLHIEIVESDLNLFNSKSLIAYKINGQLKYKNHWQPIIEEIHISERINTDTLLHCDRIIEITPVIKDKEDKDAKDGSYPFSFKNEHTITSNHWGINRIKFICGQKEQTIELQQRK